jgi:hypothetical protein
MAKDYDEHDNGARPQGRPARMPRIRVVTTIEPAKLKKLRAYAYRENKSIGEIVDAYVAKHIFPSSDPADYPGLAE